jgi:predicted dehydrogenase
MMAQQLSERIGVGKCFADLADLLKQTSPDVVHILAPPQSHFALAKQCLDAGSHVYLEKPFTITAGDAESLIRLANERGLKITAGHNGQFTREMLQMRRLVAQGALGRKPIHVECHFPYSLDDVSYMGPVLSNREHWVRKLPGQLLHNVISHAVARLAEFLDDDIDEIVARAYQSSQLQKLGGGEIFDELRVLLRDASGTTAFFCFSTQIRPGLNQLRLCGTDGVILVDNSSGSVIRYRNRSYKSYLSYVIPPLNRAWEYLRNGLGNFGAIVSRRLYQDSGMKDFFASFYDSIRRDGPPPIPYREIILTARIMDEIFSQIGSNRQ